MRFGVGGNVGQVNNVTIQIRGELVSVDDGDDSETGFGLHAAAIASMSEAVSLSGQLGFLSIDELDGPELKLGARFKTSPRFSLSLDYRTSMFDADGGDVDFTDIRVGAAYHIE